MQPAPNEHSKWDKLNKEFDEALDIAQSSGYFKSIANKKTAMQELIEDITIEKNLGYITENAANRILDYINNLYLNQEKEQIIEAFDEGIEFAYPTNGTNYYNQKYNNDPTRTNSNISEEKL